MWVLLGSLCAAPATLWSAPAPDVATAAKLYQKHCSACHGEKGNGQSRADGALNPPPKDFTSVAVQQELSRERMIASVTHGRPDTAMVGWGNKLSPQQIEGIVDYIRATFMKPHQSAAAPAAVASPHATTSPPASHGGAVRGGPGSNSRRIIPVSASLGERVYLNNCAVCHGDKGAGAMWTQASLNPPPRDFTSAQARQELTRARMVTSVTYGRPDTAMMSFRKRLTDAEIAAVVDYVRAAFIDGSAKSASTSAAPPPGHGSGAMQPGAANANAVKAPVPIPIVDADMSLPFPKGLSGDAAKGRAFYMENCYVCHGKAGDGEGPRAAFIRPKPRNFLHPDARRTLNRPTLLKAIYDGKVGTVMPAWGKVLSEQEIANVAEFVFQGFVKGKEAGENGETKKKMTTP